MKLEVSIGEAIDKLSILELKMKKINDSIKLLEIQKEIDALADINQYKIEHTLFYKMLTYVNETIWDMTDTIKGMILENNEIEFARISNQIFEFNQKRFRIKSFFNTLTNSLIKEQKSYALSYCKIIIPDETTFYNKLAEINYLSIEYDRISFECPFISIVENIFKTPNIDYTDIDTNTNSLISVTINLSEFEISSDIKQIFEFEPIKYINGGMFGDFIHGLSVINEHFYNTGRKGLLYIADGYGGDVFRNGLQNTYEDTYPVIIKQNYIQDYKIYNNEQFDINLNDWRKNPLLWNQNLYHSYKQIYNIEWGKHKWLTVPIDDKWSDTIFINTTDYRWPEQLDFQSIYSKYNDKLVFISADSKQYEHFITKTGLTIPYIQINTFTELCTMISSCKLFIAALSAPLSVAHAIQCDRIIGNSNQCINFNLNFELWNNVIYS